jgi:hypothetical protein
LLIPVMAQSICLWTVLRKITNTGWMKYLLDTPGFDCSALRRNHGSKPDGC